MSPLFWRMLVILLASGMIMFESSFSMTMVIVGVWGFWEMNKEVNSGEEEQDEGAAADK